MTEIPTWAQWLVAVISPLLACGAATAGARGAAYPEVIDIGESAMAVRAGTTETEHHRCGVMMAGPVTGEQVRAARLVAGLANTRG